MSVFSTFSLILGLLVTGKLLRWRGFVTDRAALALNQIVLNVCLPAAILLVAPKLEFRAELIGLIAMPWCLLIAAVALVFSLARLLRFDRASTANLLLQIPLGNTAFVGYAVIPLLVGEGALRYAVVYDQLGSFAILVSYGLFVVAWYAGGERPTFAAIGRRIISFPPFLALIVALTVMPVSPPRAIEWGLQWLAYLLLPMVVLALGMQLKLRLPRQHLLPLSIGLLGRLVLMPLLALGLSELFGLSGDVRLVAIYLSAMSPMMTSAAMLSAAGLAPELAAALTGYGIVLSMITLPLWHVVLSA